MSVDNTTAAAASAYAQTGTTSATNPKATLDKDGFLKMFVAQMQNQDPSSSQDPNESTQQMAMFSMVEQMTNLVMQEQTVSQQLGTQSAVGLIGHTVSYTDTNGNLQSGKVESVQSAKGATTITVDGQTGIDPTSILQVA
jgi:flagellar basal-body rod modification protein FlgD